MPYGIEQVDRDAAKVQAIAVLAARARAQDNIAYSDLCGRITAVDFDPHSAAFDAFLGEVSADEFAAGRGMLSALVVHKSGDLRPGPGFYELAKSLGLSTTDKDACWIGQLNAVYASWPPAPLTPSA